jgi:hypothetical protein
MEQAFVVPVTRHLNIREATAGLANVPRRRAHVACGFEETERVVCFRKRLADAG